MAPKAAAIKIKPRRVVEYFKNGIKKSEGFINSATRKPVGEWYYYNQFGRVTTSGYYDAHGRKSGFWLTYAWEAGDAYRTKFVNGKSGEITFVKKISKIQPRNLPDAIHQIMRLASA